MERFNYNVYRRLNRALGRVTPDQYHAGITWYDTMRAELRQLSEKHAVPFNITCAVCAALSPNSKWEFNLRDTETALETYLSGELGERITLYGVKGGGYRPQNDPTAFHKRFNNGKKFMAYPMSVVKAWYILTTRDISFLRGPKITAFYNNLAGHNLELVTVDVHMYNLAMGTWHTTDTIPNISGKTYQKIANAIRKVARKHNETPQNTQAALWVYQRDIAWKLNKNRRKRKT